jgi:hypothetical protein
MSLRMSPGRQADRLGAVRRRATGLAQRSAAARLVRGGTFVDIAEQLPFADMKTSSSILSRSRPSITPTTTIRPGPYFHVGDIADRVVGVDPGAAQVELEAVEGANELPLIPGTRVRPSAWFRDRPSGQVRATTALCRQSARRFQRQHSPRGPWCYRPLLLRAPKGRYADRLEFLARRARAKKLGSWQLCPEPRQSREAAETAGCGPQPHRGSLGGLPWDNKLDVAIQRCEGDAGSRHRA